MLKNVLLIAATLAVVSGGVVYFHSQRSSHKLPDLGVPVYPGARPADTATLPVGLSSRDRARFARVVLLETQDPIEKVISFYREHLPGKTQLLERQARGMPAAIFRTDVNGTAKLILVTAGEDTRQTEIAIGDIAAQTPPQKR